MKKILVRMKNGKRNVVDLEKCKCIYENGAWSSRGSRVYATAKKTLIVAPWSQWQGEDPEPYEIDKHDFMNFPHPDRVIQAFDLAGIDLPAEDDI